MLSVGAVDDIRRATDIALRSVSEFGLSAAVGPLNVGVLASGGADDGAWLMRDNGTMAQLVEAEVGSLHLLQILPGAAYILAVRLEPTSVCAVCASPSFVVMALVHPQRSTNISVSAFEPTSGVDFGAMVVAAVACRSRL